MSTMQTSWDNLQTVLDARICVNSARLGEIFLLYMTAEAMALTMVVINYARENVCVTRKNSFCAYFERNFFDGVIIVMFYWHSRRLFDAPLTGFSKSFYLLLLIICTCSAQYVVEVKELKSNSYHAVLQCDATGADFGAEVPVTAVALNETGCAYSTTPQDSCEDTINPGTNYTWCFNYFAVVPRGNCSFSEKAYHAQRGMPEPYSALIIYNDAGHMPVSMAGSKYADKVDIPVVMVSFTCMENMMGRFSAKKGFVVVLRAIPGYYDLVKYLIPLVAVVAFCFLVLCISLAVRVCRERRRLARKRLSKRNLKKLPTKKFKREDKPEMCAICLDDFIEGEKLRILPCSHAYHCKCIDPWLTKNRKVCPICKRKVLQSGESDSSDSDSERQAGAPASSSATTFRENAPLLSNAEPMAVADQRLVSDESMQSHAEGPANRSLRVFVLRPGHRAFRRPVEDQSTNEQRSSIVNRVRAISDNMRRHFQSYYDFTEGERHSTRSRAAVGDASNVVNADNNREFAADNSAFDENSDSFHVPTAATSPSNFTDAHNQTSSNISLVTACDGSGDDSDDPVEETTSKKEVLHHVNDTNDDRRS